MRPNLQIDDFSVVPGKSRNSFQAENLDLHLPRIMCERRLVAALNTGGCDKAFLKAVQRGILNLIRRVMHAAPKQAVMGGGIKT